MLTPSYGLTATERVLPRLALDFTTASLDPRITFTRADATATKVNSSGFIETVAADTARFDFDPITLACKGLLIEESRSNLVFPSADFTTWAALTTNRILNAGTSPDNQNNANKLAPTLGSSTTGSYVLKQVTKAASAITYTGSIYLQADEYEQAVVMLHGASAGNNVQSTITLTSGAASTPTAGGTFTNPAVSVINAGSGWWRVVLTGTSNSDTQINFRIYPRLVGGTGDGTSGILAWGAQLEAGAFPTSYIPTTSAALTRNADVATMTGTNFSDWYNATEGTFSVQANVTSLATQQYVFAAVQGASFNNAIGVNTQLAGSYLYVGDAGVTQATILSAVTANTNAKFVGAYKANSFAYTTNAANTSTDSSGTVPTVDNLIIGSRNGGAAHFNGTMQAIYYYPQRLTNAEVQAFSK